MSVQAEHVPIEHMHFFGKLEDACDEAFDLVSKWPQLAKETVGKQLVRAFDSLGANLVEGDGRGTQPDSIRFFVIARASGRETRFWLRRAAKRNLITDSQASRFEEAIDHALKATNKLIAYRRSVDKTVVREEINFGYDRLVAEIEDDS